MLYGSTNPREKLPFTIAEKEGDYGTAVVPDMMHMWRGSLWHFDKNGTTPRYEFGFWLSYTTCAYLNLSVLVLSTAAPSKGTAPGGLKSLFDVVATVTASITNNGTVTGAEVA